MTILLKPGPFKRIVKINLPSRTYGTIQFGTAIDSQVAMPNPLGLDYVLYPLCFVYSKETFPSSWLVPYPYNNYILEYIGDNGAWTPIRENTAPNFIKRAFHTFGYMNNVVVAGRTLPPGPFLDAQGKQINTDSVGYDKDYGLIYLGFRFRGAYGTPDGNLYIKNPEQYFGKQIRITIRNPFETL